MALRGEGSLQRLLGKRVSANRSSGSSRSKAQRSEEPATAGKNGPVQHGLRSFFERSGGGGGNNAATPAACARADARSAEATAAAAASEGKLLHSAAQPNTLVERAPLTTLPANSAAAAPAPASSPPAASAWTVSTSIVGSRFQRGNNDGSGSAAAAAAAAVAAAANDAGGLRLQREPDNAFDSNAIIVVFDSAAAASSGGSGGIDGSTTSPPRNLGHLPAAVAHALAPLLDAGRVAVAIDADQAGGADALLLLRVVLRLSVASGVPASERNAAAASIEAAAGACDAGVLDATTGAVLCANFRAMADQIRAHDLHLLDGDEERLLGRVEALSEPARRLLLRLLLRRRNWFAVRGLVAAGYADVPAPLEAAQELSRAGAALLSGDAAGRDGDNNDAAAAAASLLASLPCAALKELLRQLAPPNRRRGGGSEAGGAGGGATTKAALIAQLLVCTSSERLLSCVEAAHGPSVQLTASVRALFSRLQRVAFLEEGAGMSRCLAVERGAVRYPTYAVRRAGAPPVWRDRAALLDYEAALGEAAAVNDALATGDMAAVLHAAAPALAAVAAGAHKLVAWDAAHGAMPYTPADATDAADAGDPAAAPLFLCRFSAAWVRASVATVAVSALERVRRYDDAVELLQRLLGGNCCPARRGEWWARLSINLQHLGQLDSALEVAEAALADGWVRQGDRLGLQRRVLRLGKPPRRWRRPAWAQAALAEPAQLLIVARRLANSIGNRNRYYGYDGAEVCVEELALQHFAREEGGGWRGVHSEGGTWATLFGLVMWDVLFADAPGAFRSPLQAAPLDLGTDAFYPARRELIDTRLLQVADGHAGALVERHWRAHKGTICAGVSWDTMPLQELLEIADCLGGVGLSVAFRVMAEDGAGSQGGLPDLILWKPEARRAMLVEVKGPTDRLSDQQCAWMATLSAAGLQVAVCKVNEPKNSAAKQPCIT